MTRLWDKGAPLDERVLRYTAGEDYALDDRLVPYDVRASIAHAEMLNARQLLSLTDLDAIRDGLTALADDNDHWAATVTSASFRGLSRVKQHQLVNAAFGDKLGGELHALALTTRTP